MKFEFLLLQVLQYCIDHDISFICFLINAIKKELHKGDNNDNS